MYTRANSLIWTTLRLCSFATALMACQRPHDRIFSARWNRFTSFNNKRRGSTKRSVTDVCDAATRSPQGRVPPHTHREGERDDGRRPNPGLFHPLLPLLRLLDTLGFFERLQLRLATVSSVVQLATPVFTLLQLSRHLCLTAQNHDGNGNGNEVTAEV